MSRRDKRRARFGMAYLGYPDCPYPMARIRRAIAAASPLVRWLADHPEYVEKLKP